MTKAELDQLIGKIVGKWQLFHLEGSGKSAAVFRGTDGTRNAAIKVFFPSLVEEFGKNAQLQRIERELTLCGSKRHPNLIEMLDGGECKTTGHLYVVMELMTGQNLAAALPNIPRDRIRPIISQVASAARYLLDNCGIVHRDIKPDNINIDPDFSCATLLDLGVIRPLDVSKLAASSNGERQSFLGTLRYSPPEYLFRTEKQNIEGYRAITFYQLGAVLYDLIVRERLFWAFSSPYPRLVKAVEQETPKIQQPDVPQDLIWLAKNCLLKNPEHRLRFVKWSDFESSNTTEPGHEARSRVMRRFASSLEAEPTTVNSPKTAWNIQRAVTSVQQRITSVLKDICSGEKMFPRSSTRELPSFGEPPSANVLLEFEVDKNLQMHNRLTVLITAQLIDIEPETVEIKLRAMLGYEDSLQGQHELRATQGLLAFEGVMDDAMISTALENALFRIIDISQNLTSDIGKYFVSYIS